MEIKVTDSNGETCDDGDVIIYHYPNPRIKHIGILKYKQDQGELSLTDDQGWIRFPCRGGTSERLCHISERNELRRLFGRCEFRSDKALKQFNSIIYQ